MKRRNVLKGTAAGAAAVAAGGLGSSGCATTGTNLGGPGHADPAARAFLASLDRQLASTDDMRAVDGFYAAARPGPRTPAQAAVVEQHDGLFRRVMRSLIITQQFRELPVEVQVHPEVQARVDGHLDEIDATMFELTDFLAGQTEAQRAGLRDHLRAQPDTAMDLGEVLDRHADGLGLSKHRRRQLRSMMAQATFRLRTEAPGALIDEYTAKVDRLRGADGTNALALQLSEKMGQRAFWKYQQAVAQTYGGPGTVAPTAGVAASAVASSSSSSSPDPQPSTSRGKRIMRAGGYMMGIGVVVFGVSALLVDAAFGFVVGVTVGALMVAIGFITLIVGAIINA